MTSRPPSLVEAVDHILAPATALTPAGWDALMGERMSLLTAARRALPPDAVVVSAALLRAAEAVVAIVRKEADLGGMHAHWTGLAQAIAAYDQAAADGAAGDV